MCVNFCDYSKNTSKYKRNIWFTDSFQDEATSTTWELNSTREGSPSESPSRLTGFSLTSTMLPKELFSTLCDPMTPKHSTFTFWTLIGLHFHPVTITLGFKFLQSSVKSCSNDSQECISSCSIISYFTISSFALIFSISLNLFPILSQSFCVFNKELRLVNTHWRSFWNDSFIFLLVLFQFL